MPIQSYQIAPNWDNEASFVYWENLTDGSGNKFPPIASLGEYTLGQDVLRGDGSLTFDGLPEVIWTVSDLLQSQFDYLKSTYCAGGYSGKVTIATRINSELYSHYNGWLYLPRNYRIDPQTGWISELKISIRRLKAT